VALSWEAAFTARAVLIGALLILTTPVASHEIARAAAKEHGMRSGIKDQGLD
jgi:multisubunit Na+/H+ antiporter MnhG subunit